jgi:hypothetical protein
MAMNALEAVQGLGGSLYLFAAVVVSIRLLVLAHRTRGLPELLLGLTFLLSGAIGSCLEVAGMVSAQLQAEPGQVGMLLMIGKCFAAAGVACFVLFIWWVFHRDQRWALVPATAVIAMALVALAGMAAAGTLSSGVSQAPWFWIEFVSRFATQCWLGLEAGRYYLRMKRRMKLNLADPVVTNRFLLWTIAAFFGAVLMATVLAPAVFGRTHLLSHAALVVFGVSGAAAAACYWLAFFPPEAYRQLLRARAAAET